MNSSSPSPARHMLDGTIRVFLSEALAVPTGILIAVVLSRRLGPAGFGLFVLAVTLITWVEWSITAVFTRATIKFVGEAGDWRPVGAAVVRLTAMLSGGAVLLLWLLAEPIATWLHEPVLAGTLRLFALDIPLFCLAHAHRNILVGIGRFRQRAMASAGRWLSRLFLIVLLVELGLSLQGAILGSLGASLVDLAIGRIYVRPALFGRSPYPARLLWGFALPLFLSSLSMRLFEKLDLLILKILGGTAALAGIYGAAQTISLAPGIFSLSFSPLLLSLLSQTLKAGDSRQAIRMGRQAMRLILLLLPFAGMTAGAGAEIVGLVYGSAFLAAAPLLAVLIFGALAAVMILVATTILTAAGKPRWTFFLAGPMIPLAGLGHLYIAS